MVLFYAISTPRSLSLCSRRRKESHDENRMEIKKLGEIGTIIRGKLRRFFLLLNSD